MYRHQGLHEEALKMHIKSLDVKTRILVGDNHLDVAISHGNIGSVLIQVYMGKHEEALGHMQKVLRLSSSSLGTSTRS